MKRNAALLALILALATPIHAETMRVSQSDVTIRDTTRSGAVAEIFYENSTGDGVFLINFTLTHNNVVCHLTAETGMPEPDTLTAECEGLVAAPRTLTLEDGTDGIIYVYEGALSS